jgi:putative ABC transport system substrate-binding protein
MRKLAYALIGAVIATPAFAQDITVGVTAIVEHPALDAVRNGVRDALAAAGFNDGAEINFVYQSAGGDVATAAQIANQFVGDGVNVIVPISTPSAQAALTATADIPIVFSAVTAPVAAGLVTSINGDGGNITGTSDLTPVADHLALILEIIPDATRVGVLYNAGEANSVFLVEILKAAAAEHGVTIVEATADNSAAVQSAAASLVGDVDAIYVPTDNTIVSALDAVIGVGEDAGVPVFAGDTDTVANGAIATIGFDYYEHGLQAGAIVVRILNGEDPGTIPVQFATGGQLAVNPGAAERMGATIPQAVIDRADIVVE